MNRSTAAQTRAAIIETNPRKNKILQVNVDRGKGAWDLLRHYAQSNEIDIALIAEPNKRAVSKEPWFRDKNSDAGIRVYNTNILVYDTNSNMEDEGFVWVELKDMVLYSCYVSPNISREEYEAFLNRLSISLKKHKKEILVAGDFNAKSHAWGSNIEDPKGKMLLDWIAENQLIIQNEGTEPTFMRHGQTSFIDVTLSTAKLSTAIENWRVDAKEENLSYHRNIYFTVGGLDPMEVRTVGHKWRLKQELIPQFKERLAEEAGEIVQL